MAMGMKTNFLAALMISATTAYADIAGSFIQLHRGKADRTVNEWREDFQQIKALGGDMVIVQWTAEQPVLYFDPSRGGRMRSPEAAMDEPVPLSRGAADRLRGMEEVYPVVERILVAAEEEGMSVILGLQHHPEYWDQIKGRQKVIRDFFRVRMARNESLQRALLEAFGDRAAWTGYYIPDELDDYTWRAQDMSELVRTYVHSMASILRGNDPERSIAISAFFRGRTDPDHVATNFMDILAGSGIDYVLLQDGVGVGDPPLPFVHLYYEAFTRKWTPEMAGERGALPEMWCVIETFKQTSGSDEPFVAVPAPAERLRGQVQVAQAYFPRLILFTYGNYLRPDLGAEAREAFDAIAGVSKP